MKDRIIAERYRLVRQLGAGAAGAVWLAEHLTLGSEVAVKLIRDELAQVPTSRARFEREAKIVAKLDSAHVVKVLDHGTTDADEPFMVLEYLRGATLRQRLDERGKLSVAETSRIVSHVCRAMTQAHDAGLVHRDLKPDNIFIAQQDDEEVIKVLDFGAAKTTDLIGADGVDPTRTGALVGTPFYMSPEQAQGLKTVDHRSDLWALGVVVFECLTGQRPFEAAELGPLIAKIILGPLPTPSTFMADTTAEIDAWMAIALERDPDQRCSSARELATTFMKAAGLHNTTTSATPSSPPAQPRQGSAPELATPVEADDDEDAGKPKSGTLGEETLPESTTASPLGHEAAPPAAAGSQPRSDPLADEPLPPIPMGGPGTAGRRGSVPGWAYVVILLAVLAIGIAWEVLR